MTLFMLSLGGIPPTAGFMGKVYVFGVALDAGTRAARRGRRAEQRGLGLLLPARHRGDVHGGAAGRAGARVVGGPLRRSRWRVAVVLTLWWGVQAQALLEQARRSVLGLL